MTINSSTLSVMLGRWGNQHGNHSLRSKAVSAACAVQILTCADLRQHAVDNGRSVPTPSANPGRQLSGNVRLCFQTLPIMPRNAVTMIHIGLENDAYWECPLFPSFLVRLPSDQPHSRPRGLYKNPEEIRWETEEYIAESINTLIQLLNFLELLRISLRFLWGLHWNMWIVYSSLPTKKT
jgi:hypothetical protein